MQSAFTVSGIFSILFIIMTYLADLLYILHCLSYINLFLFSICLLFRMSSHLESKLIIYIFP